MLKLWLLLLPLTNAYYSETFFGNKCFKDVQLKNVYAMREVLFCKNVFFSAGDQTKISQEDFVLSDEDIIYFVDSDMGTVNHNFFTKFPVTRKMVFHNVTMRLASSANMTIDEDYIPLETLMIRNSRILNNRNSDAFHSLVNLKSFEITESSLEDNIIDAQLLRNSPKISLSYIPLSKIENGAFAKLPDLLSLELIGLNLTYINPKLLRHNTKLEQLDLKDNLFSELPSELPDSLLTLRAVNNKIESLSRESFAGLKGLKELYLSYNLLTDIESDTFDDMVNLEVLNLGSNKLKNFDKRLVKNLKFLKTLYLGGNLIRDENISDMFMYAGYEP